MKFQGYGRDAYIKKHQNDNVEDYTVVANKGSEHPVPNDVTKKNKEVENNED